MRLQIFYSRFLEVMKQLTISLLFAVTFLACAPEKNTEYYHQLNGIDQWLQASKVSLEGAEIWPDALDQPDKVSLSLSDGVAGKLIFYLQMYLETEDSKYLTEAKAAGEYILANLPQKTDSLQNAFWAFSPYGNVCGPAFALIESFLATNEAKYMAGAEHIIDVINHFAINKTDTLSWDRGNDVLGGLAGTGLFMLYAGEKLNRPDLIAIAEKAGNTLISRASKNVGMSWKRGQNSRFDLPNFSHGAAGIGYFLARLYEVTGSSMYFDAALEANTYLQSIAKTEGGIFLIPYGFPDPGWSRPFDIGWAHGPAGVARFYRQLFKVTNEQKWMEREMACFESIRFSGAPGMPSSTDFGTEQFYLDSRFGIASVASFLFDIELTSQQDLDYRKEMVVYVLGKSIMDENKLYWPQTRFNFMQNAEDTTAFTGYFYGASGYGMLLLKAQAKANGTSYIRFVDDPY